MAELLSNDVMFGLIPKEEAYQILRDAKVPIDDEGASDPTYLRVMHRTASRVLDALIAKAEEEEDPWERYDSAANALHWLREQRGD